VGGRVSSLHFCDGSPHSLTDCPVDELGKTDSLEITNSDLEWASFTGRQSINATDLHRACLLCSNVRGFYIWSGRCGPHTMNEVIRAGVLLGHRSFASCVPEVATVGGVRCGQDGI
jgi:hypothetical protein